ncbi:hypothetical protein [Streptomyces sp. NPDC059215]|uniref:hypothetical protein n=1 Tax=Streptomyces sp. NPDC059215 TaxID=3346772 RepID=UPI0036CD934E
MTKTGADQLTLLRELDDPQWLEWPAAYDRYAVAARFGELVARLESDFGVPCMAEQDTQDSSEYGRATVPAEVTTCGTRIVVCVSKFGSVALVCAENPGAFLGTQEAQDEGELDAADLASVDRAVVELGFTVLPEQLVDSDQDGPSRAHLYGQRPTWWDRFFGTF